MYKVSVYPPNSKTACVTVQGEHWQDVQRAMWGTFKEYKWKMARPNGAPEPLFPFVWYNDSTPAPTSKTEYPIGTSDQILHGWTGKMVIEVI